MYLFIYFPTTKLRHNSQLSTGSSQETIYTTRGPLVNGNQTCMHPTCLSHRTSSQAIETAQPSFYFLERAISPYLFNGFWSNTYLYSTNISVFNAVYKHRLLVFQNYWLETDYIFQCENISYWNFFNCIPIASLLTN